MPYLDSFTTWASVITTWMVARKILENWIYWFVIDSVSIVLYVNRSLHLTAVLFAVYLVIIVFGYRDWRRTWAASRDEAPSCA
jgi:nicotinamide mononucleotide transporter